jgi:hypothetical protein
MAALRGKCYWAKVHEPEPNYFNPEKVEYSITIGNLTETDEALLTSLNIGDKVRDDVKGTNGGGRFIQFRAKNVKTNYNPETGERDQIENTIIVVDADLNPVPTDVLIGNGSEVVVSFQPIHYKKLKKWGVDLLGVQVLNLVEYSPGADPMADFKAAASGSESAFAA